MTSDNETKEIQSLVAVKHWREQHARRVLECWEQSGLNLRQFCREFEIGYHRLQYWKKRVPVSNNAIDFIEVIPFQTDESDAGDRMEVSFPNHRTIRITPGFDESAVRRLIRIVEQ